VFVSGLHEALLRRRLDCRDMPRPLKRDDNAPQRRSLTPWFSSTLHGYPQVDTALLRAGVRILRKQDGMSSIMIQFAMVFLLFILNQP